MRFCLYLFFVGIFLQGCVAPKPKDQITMPSETVYNHIVSSDRENLQIIATWYTGNAKNWRPLLAYNGLIKPFDITPGTIVRIPQDLIVRFDPIDSEFIKKGKAAHAAWLRKRQSAAKIEDPKTDSQPSTSFPTSETPSLAELPLDSSPEVVPEEDDTQQDLLIQNLLPESQPKLN